MIPFDQIISYAGQSVKVAAGGEDESNIVDQIAGEEQIEKTPANLMKIAQEQYNLPASEASRLLNDNGYKGFKAGSWEEYILVFSLAKSVAEQTQ